MKMIPFLTLFLLFATISFATEIHQEFQVQPGKRLTIDLKTGGKIRIIGWNKSTVKVDASITGPDGEKCDVQVKETEQGIDIRSRYIADDNDYHTDGRFEIRVPSRFDIEIESMGGGVTIQNVEGEFEGRTMGGGLDLSGLKGKISLSTMGGRINLTRSHLDGEVSTMGGEVLIEEVTGNVQGSTMGGKVIHKKGASAGGTGSGEIEMSSMGGELNVDDAPAGAQLNTMGGDIHVRSAKDHVKAKTMGGNIRIDAIDGWVHAETMGGDVQVVMTGNAASGKRDVELVSYSGDIELTVPSGLAMTLDLELAYTKGKSGKYAIKSDFPVSMEETDEWDKSDGSPRKYINGSGTIGAGTHRVRVRTINGNIILRKS
jgi:DUF4097 and DUF4098 domain-containing protein YvlB